MRTLQAPSVQRMGYADLLRALATVAVIVIHVTGLPVATVPPYGPAWHTLNLFDSLARWCVPVFFMLSGMFLLDGDKPLTIGTLLRRNVSRVFAALICWGLFYAVVDYRLAGGSFRSPELWQAIVQALSANTHFHLWFLYAILGFYLATPILRAFVRGASERDFHWFFLLVFLLCSLIPALLHFFPRPAVSNWLYFLLLDTPVQLALVYLACYVAGYYLRHATFTPRTRRFIYALGLFGAALTAGGTVLAVRWSGGDFYLYNYFTPNVLLMAVAIFLLCKHLPPLKPGGLAARFAALTARLSFGVYLVHEFFLLLLGRWGVTALSLPPLLSIPILTAVVFALSLGVSWLIHKIPVLGRYLG